MLCQRKLNFKPFFNYSCFLKMFQRWKDAVCRLNGKAYILIHVSLAKTDKRTSELKANNIHEQNTRKTELTSEFFLSYFLSKTQVVLLIPSKSSSSFVSVSAFSLARSLRIPFCKYYESVGWVLVYTCAVKIAFLYQTFFS